MDSGVWSVASGSTPPNTEPRGIKRRGEETKEGEGKKGRREEGKKGRRELLWGTVKRNNR
ncbi:hypothetical protein EYF80_067589 [Liparis tanakae]|uniref:Uncharacterized protein n=1 Tax=Liparis tanakae TaxID=230148 RepID=A0A4Z2E0Q5_9TELE|nr:hypothetical protein EYF80_067589 [Liparis tanakae]